MFISTLKDTYINCVVKDLSFFPYLQDWLVVDFYLNYTKHYVQFQIKKIKFKSRAATGKYFYILFALLFFKNTFYSIFFLQMLSNHM